MGNSMYAKEFINRVYIGNVGALVNTHKYFYISFGLLGTGIEFLGKCLNESRNATWHENKTGLGKENFDFVLTNLMKRYAPFKDTHNLCDSLRNGMAHAFKPKNNIELTHRIEADDKGWADLQINSSGRLVLVCENLFQEFETACLEVIRKIDANEFNSAGKVYQPFLNI